jgi:hypothetical protein
MAELGGWRPDAGDIATEPDMPALDHAALVTRAISAPNPHDAYLLLTPLGQAEWVDDPKAATAFDSMREATRAAMRLPSAFRAYSLPLKPELALSRAH